MDDFSFFLKLAKPLALNLADAKDRAMAALWLKKLCQVNNAERSGITSDNIHVEYLKLLLLSMQSNRLSGIFEKPPPSESLRQPVSPGQRKIQARDMIYLVKRRKSRSSDDKSKSNRRYPRVITSIGGDMSEYVAIQEIPNFGVHGYYAVSTEPLSKWTKAQSHEAAAANLKAISSPKCRKNTCVSLLGRNEQYSDKSFKVADAMSTEEAKLTIKERSKKKIESRMRHGAKSLQKIFQAQRSEIAGVETRPCWGSTSRYIDRLIDQSPHLVADLELSEADALLHLYRDRKLRKINKSANNGGSAKNKACAISSRRRELEMRLDMPPCALLPDAFDDDRMGDQHSESKESRSCLPPNFDLHDTSMMDGPDTFDRGFSAYLSKNENYHPTEATYRRSATSISLSDYDKSACNYTDDQCESELRRTTDYGNWRNDAYESGETDQLLSINDGHRRASYSSNPTMTITKNCDAFREMSRLVADPNRREPPSRAKIKAPRIKSHSAVDETNVEIEAWDLQGHSTAIDE